LKIEMTAQARKKKVQTFHATMIVTRTEEWCVEAESAEEAAMLLAAGEGHRCHSGDAHHVEIGQLHKDAA
jgi:hypothetical protein